jgi:hypothetical protein
LWGSVWFGGGEVYCPLIAERSCSASACSANEDVGARNWGASADEAHELLFDDHSGHALHFGEAAGEGDLVQRDDFLNGLFREFLAGRGENFIASSLSPECRYQPSAPNKGPTLVRLPCRRGRVNTGADSADECQPLRSLLSFHSFGMQL